MRRIALEPGERVVTAWAERASGPGWTNMPLYVLIGNSNGVYRIETLQPEDWGRDAGAGALYNASESVHASMLAIIRRLMRGEV